MILRPFFAFSTLGEPVFPLALRLLKKMLSAALIKRVSWWWRRIGAVSAGVVLGLAPVAHAAPAKKPAKAAAKAAAPKPKTAKATQAKPGAGKPPASA
ncbi:MAG: hypothetical protein Q4F13_10215 [Pseudomonadota bacterium]|nr:hypothetical protein [Pseudomonadota bacterium]